MWIATMLGALAIGSGGPSDCQPAESLADAVAGVFGAGTEPGTLVVADLLPLDEDERARLFSAAAPPEFADLLGFDAPQTSLQPGPGFGLADGTKAFRPEALTPGAFCAGQWRAGAAGDLHFKAYVARSFFDGCDVLRLDYDLMPSRANSRRRKDELRALNEQLLLGVALAADVVDADGWPLDGAAATQRFFAVDLAAAGPWQDALGLGWPWEGSAPVGGSPPLGWSPDFAVDPLEWPFEHKVLTLRHGEYHYADESPPGPSRGTVLFVHGNPTWGFLWRDVMVELLADGWRVVAPDHFGFGLSEKLPSGQFPYAPRDHADALEDFVQALDLTDVTLVVHDWGTSTGLAMAARTGARVERILVTNGWAWNVDPVVPGAFHSLVTWGLWSASNPAPFLVDGFLSFNSGQTLAGANGLPGSAEYDAALAAFWGPFLDPATGLPLSTEALWPTWRFAAEILEDRDFLGATELDLARLASRPLAFRVGGFDNLYAELVCDTSPYPPCPAGLTCTPDGAESLCLDASGAKVYPALERFESHWDPQSIAGRRIVAKGHWAPAFQSAELASDVRYLEHFLGAGCGASGAWPRVSSTSLTLGQPGTLSVDGAQPLALGVLFGSLAAPAPLPLGSGCELWLDAFSLFTVALFALDGAGQWELAVQAPANPALAGTPLRFQAFTAAPGGAVGGFDASNGVEVVLE